MAVGDPVERADFGSLPTPVDSDFLCLISQVSEASIRGPL